MDDIVAAKFTELEANINMPTIVNILSTMSTKIVEHQEEFVRLSKDVVTCRDDFSTLQATVWKDVQLFLNDACNKLNKKVKDEASSLHNELREKIEFWLRVKKHSRQLIEDGKTLKRSH